MNRTPHSNLILGVAIALGTLIDQWFRAPRLGVGVGLFGCLAVAALLATARATRTPLTRPNLWIVAALVWLAALPAWRDSPVVVALDLAMLLVLALIASEAVTGPSLQTVAPGGYVGALASVMRGALLRAAGPTADLGSRALRRLPARGRAVALLRGLILAAPFVAVFTVLLGSADVVFGVYVQRIARLQIPIDFGELLDHGLVTVLAAWLVAGWLLHAVRARPSPANMLKAAPTGSGPPARQSAGAGLAPLPAPAVQVAADLAAASETRLAAWFGFTESATVLAAIDLLFAAFVVVQFAYLFGGRETLQIAGLTYSEYARRGFFELLAVAAIALPLVMCLDWQTRRSTALQRGGFQVLSGAMIVLIVVILGSAMVRMGLYEDAYGFTHLRVYSHGFMVWLAALCVLFLITLAMDRRQWLVFGTFVLVVIGVAATGAFGPDRFIAEQNLARYRAGRPLDAAQLTDLSADATPIVLAALDTATARGDIEVRNALGTGLRGQLGAMDAASEDPWPTWNFARSESLHLLSLRRAEIEAYPLPGRSSSRARTLDGARP